MSTERLGQHHLSIVTSFLISLFCFCFFVCLPKRIIISEKLLCRKGGKGGHIGGRKVYERNSDGVSCVFRIYRTSFKRGRVGGEKAHCSFTAGTQTALECSEFCFWKRSITLYSLSSTSSNRRKCFLKALGDTSILLQGQKRTKTKKKENKTQTSGHDGTCVFVH